jgi:tetratricopeptide (TPR) repeat protein
MLMAGGAYLTGCGDLLSQAAELNRQGDLPGAEALYGKILAEDPEDLGALNGLAIDLMLQKRYDEALPLQERIVALDSKDAQMRVELGFNYLNHQGLPQRAVDVLAQAVALEPTAKYLTFLAQAQTEVDASAAESSLRRAILTQPDYLRAYSVLIGLLRDQGRAADAEQVVRDAKSRGLDTAALEQISP